MNMAQWSWTVFAVAIGAWACFSAVVVLARAAGSAGSARWRWLCLAAVVFGIGVWTTHFVAMIAETSAMDMGYAPGLTALSALVAILCALPGFILIVKWPGKAGARIGASAIVATAVTVMHFTGMAAMTFAGHIIYRPVYVLTAIDLGFLCNILAFRRSDQIERVAVRVEMALLLALGIASVHFIAMAGTIFAAGMAPVGQATLIGRWATLASAGASALAIGMISVIALMDQRWRRIHQETELLRHLADSTIEGLLIHHQGRALWGNSVLQHITGLPAEAIADHDAALIASPETREILRRHLETPVDSIDEIEILRPDGTQRTVEILSRPIRYAGRDAGVVAVRDITDRRQAEAWISHLAHHDSLTGLGNRTLFNERLDHAIRDVASSGRSLALLTIDLSRFKSVNDLYGHRVGDQLLTLVAARISQNLRRDDTVARLGGDEFAIIQPYAEQPAAAAGLARRFVETLGRPFEINGQMVSIGASIGVALCPDNAQTPQSLLQASDLALDRAKRDGRDTFCFFDAGMDIRFRERRMLEQDLRQAIEREQLTVDYQPFFDCASMTVGGFEALARWHHETRGPISPAEFIPIAEEASLIMPLGRFVLQTACRTALSWPADYKLAVNLSPVQFHNPHLADDIIEIITDVGLPPARLELEVTESVLIDDVDRTLAVLIKLKAHGIRIALDDFGTGYSSLSTLRRFPFDKLKIDRSFVQNLGTDDDAAAIVRAILALGVSLRLEVIAEGVETTIQLEALKTGGCNLVQGFLLGRPTADPLIPASADLTALTDMVITATKSSSGDAATALGSESDVRKAWSA